MRDDFIRELEMTAATALSIQIPMLPASIVTLLGLGSTDPSYFERVLEISEGDPGLTTLAFQMVNSSAFVGMAAPGTLDQALMRIGAHRFVSAVVSSHLIQVFVPASPEMAKLWGHAIRTSVAARRLAVLWANLKIRPDWAAVAGLIHNLGAMALGVHHLENYREVLRAHDLDDDRIIQAERSTFGADHEQVGRSTAAQVGLPEDLQAVVSTHHGHGGPKLPIVDLVRIAAQMTRLSTLRIGEKSSGDGGIAQEIRRLASDLRVEVPADPEFQQILLDLDADARLELDRLGIPKN